MRAIDPSEHEFVAKVWLVQHQERDDAYAKSHWELVDLVATDVNDDESFYCAGNRYRVRNDWMFPRLRERAAVPKEMVRAAQIDWLDTRPADYATAVIADSEVQAFEDTRFMSDDELNDFADGDRLPAGQRAAIWALALLLSGLVLATLLLAVMGPK